MLDATDWSDKDGLILALSNSESPGEIWEKIPAQIKGDPKFIWKAIESNERISSSLTI